MKNILAGIACGLLGLLAGLAANRLARPNLAPPPPPVTTIPVAATPSPPVDAPAERARQREDTLRRASTEQQIARLTAEIESLQSRLDALPPRPPTDSTEFALPKKLIPNLRIDALAGDYALTANVVAALSIQPEEQDRLEEAIFQARTRLDELELARSTVLSESDDLVEIAVAPFVPEGQAVQDKLFAEIRSILDENRANLFLEFFNKRRTSDAYFNWFGQTDQVITLSRNEDGSFAIDSEYTAVNPPTTLSKDGPGSGPPASGTQTQTVKRNELPAKYRHLFELE